MIISTDFNETDTFAFLIIFQVGRAYVKSAKNLSSTYRTGMLGYRTNNRVRGISEKIHRATYYAFCKFPMKHLTKYYEYLNTYMEFLYEGTIRACH